MLVTKHLAINMKGLYRPEYIMRQITVDHNALVFVQQ